MALLCCALVCAVIYSTVLLVLRWPLYLKLGKRANRPFVVSAPDQRLDIDPPLWMAGLSHIPGLLSSGLWIMSWPSFTEVWMTVSLVPLLFIPFPTILNNALEWVMYIVYGNAKAAAPRDKASLWDAVTSAGLAVSRWLTMLLGYGSPLDIDDASINYNHALLCYVQNEGASTMHDLSHPNPAADGPGGVLHQFPDPVPNSRANAVVMAKCATMVYDRWHNVDKAVSTNWTSKQDNLTSSMVTAWDFDRVSVTSAMERVQAQGPPSVFRPGLIGSRLCSAARALFKEVESAEVQPAGPGGLESLLQRWINAVEAFKTLEYPTSINTNACLLRIERPGPDGGKEIALVLVFRGTEALQTVDWISDLSEAQPPANAEDRAVFPRGFTHQGFRDALGLGRSLEPAEELPGGSDMFNNSYLKYVPRSAAKVWAPGRVERVSSRTSPYTVITEAIEKQLKKDKDAKVFVTGHSLGGALTHLYAGTLFLRAMGQQGPVSGLARAVVGNLEAFYTFGEPRVGGTLWLDSVSRAKHALDSARASVKGKPQPQHRYVRVVNSTDIVPRVPPPLGGYYQHSGHLKLIRTKFLIMGQPPKSPDSPGPGQADSQDPYLPELSPVTSLREMPELFLGLTAWTVFLKLVLSLIVLASSGYKALNGKPLLRTAIVAAVVAALAPLLVAGVPLVVTLLCCLAVPCYLMYIVSPELYNGVIGPKAHLVTVTAQLLMRACARPLGERALLASNPVYAVARVFAFLGPAPIVGCLNLLLLPLFTATGLVLLTFTVEPLLLLALFAFMPPVIMGGLVDHSMAEYYTACWLSCDADWK